MDVHRIVTRRARKNKPYKRSYKPNLYFADYPDQEKLSSQFHLQPMNEFEERLAQNLIN